MHGQRFAGVVRNVSDASHASLASQAVAVADLIDEAATQTS